jgi:hypothetical protein
LIDALTFWQAGFHNVTASYGVSGFTPDHLAAFRLHGTRRVLIAYDRDAAGDKAAITLKGTEGQVRKMDTGSTVPDAVTIYCSGRVRFSDLTLCHLLPGPLPTPSAFSHI